MKPRTTSALLLAFITIIILTSTEVHGIPSCCVRVSKSIPRSKLRLVTKHEFQFKSGPCDIDALILHIKRKWVCADLGVLKHLKKLKPKKQRKPKQTQAKTE